MLFICYFILLISVAILALFSPNYPDFASIIVFISTFLTTFIQISQEKKIMKYLADRNKKIPFLSILITNLFPILMLLIIVFTISSYYSMNINLKSPRIIIPVMFTLLSIALLLALILRSLVPLFKKHQIRVFELVEIITSIFSLIFLFAALYVLIFIIDTSAFTGNRSSGTVAIAIDFIYFSVTTFTTLGFGDIYPTSTLAKLLVIIEPLVSTIGISTVLVVLVKNVVEAPQNSKVSTKIPSCPE